MNVYESHSICWQAYGADEDQELGLKGETLSNVLSARRFVGWYNGLPRDKDFPVNLDVEEVAVLGQGNVALDVARILLTPIDRLKVGLIYTSRKHPVASVFSVVRGRMCNNAKLTFMCCALFHQIILW
jgi:hypothetical protein